MSSKKWLRLSKSQKQRMIDLYQSSLSKKEVQEILAKEWECSVRTVREQAKNSI